MTIPKKSLLQPAYVLHQRPYRETSVILEIFTRDYGRVAVVAKGVRGKRAKFRGILQPFQSLLISWSGRSDLVNLQDVESFDVPLDLSGRLLICAWYLNELLLKLLIQDDAYPSLFDSYRQVLVEFSRLNDPDSAKALDVGIQCQLRFFEKLLLEQTGYGLNLTHEAQTGQPIDEQHQYFYLADQGPVIARDEQSERTVLGSSLLAFSQHILHTNQQLRDARLIARTALTPMLGGRPLKSRELFRDYCQMKV